MEPSTRTLRRRGMTRLALFTMFALLGTETVFVAASDDTTTAGRTQGSSPNSRDCPKEVPLEPGPDARDKAIAAVRRSLRTGPQEWRTYEIESAYPATNGKGFSLVAFPMCGPVVGARTWVVEIHFPKLEPSASMAQWQAFVS